MLAIEPHLTLGSGEVVDAADGWTIRTRDRKRVAVFEHTVVVTKTGCEVLTRRAKPLRMSENLAGGVSAILV